MIDFQKVFVLALIFVGSISNLFKIKKNKEEKATDKNSSNALKHFRNNDWKSYIQENIFIKKVGLRSAYGSVTYSKNRSLKRIKLKLTKMDNLLNTR